MIKIKYVKYARYIVGKDKEREVKTERRERTTLDSSSSYFHLKLLTTRCSDLLERWNGVLDDGALSV